LTETLRMPFFSVWHVAYSAMNAGLRIDVHSETEALTGLVE
jgi:hypothetical protein